MTIDEFCTAARRGELSPEDTARAEEFLSLMAELARHVERLTERMERMG